MRVIALATLLLLIATMVGAQSLQGIVTDAHTHKPLAGATVVNVITQRIAYTDANGFYTIPASQGDVVAYTYIGYKSAERTKPVSVLISTLNVSLERSAYDLQEVFLRPGKLTQYQIDSAERAATYKLPLQRRPPSPFMSPASAVAEMFSKRAKRTYQFQKNFAAGEIEKFIDTRYTPELVTTLTGLIGDSIGYFMYAYPMSYDYAILASNLEIKMWIRDNFKSWTKKNAADSELKRK
jgi:hypothetical protein